MLYIKEVVVEHLSDDIRYFVEPQLNMYDSKHCPDGFVPPRFAQSEELYPRTYLTLDENGSTFSRKVVMSEETREALGFIFDLEECAADRVFDMERHAAQCRMETGAAYARISRIKRSTFWQKFKFLFGGEIEDE